MFKLDLEKAEEPEIKLPTSIGSWNQVEYVIYHNFYLTLFWKLQPI